MSIIKISDNNKNFLVEFINEKHPPSFRYFSNRTIDCIKNHVITLIGLCDNRVCSYGHIDYDSQMDTYWLGLCVLEHYQHNGYGKLMLTELINTFKQSNISEIKLTVDKNNVIAKTLYDKNGFQIISECNTHYTMSLTKDTNIMYLPVSFGEALDKLSILQIKLAKINDDRRNDVVKEYDKLIIHLKKYIDKYKFYYDELLKINLSIWLKQDNFRNNTTLTARNQLCTQIIDENDRRFRLKNKINTILDSSLKEQKGYVPKKAFLLVHQGLGDHVTAIPMTRYLATKYDVVVTVCKQKNYENIVKFYEDDKTIIIRTVPDNSPLYRMKPFVFDNNCENLKEFSTGYDLFFTGQFINNHAPWTILPFNFYKDIGFDYSIFWDYFHIPELQESNLLYNTLIEHNITNWIFIHDTSSEGRAFDYYELLKNNKINKHDDWLLINPDRNMYETTHIWYNIANTFINKKFYEFIKIVKYAKQICVTDSCFFCLAMCLQLNATECYIRPRRTHYNYNHIWGKEYKFDLASGKKIFKNIV